MTRTATTLDIAGKCFKHVEAIKEFVIILCGSTSKHHGIPTELPVGKVEYQGLLQQPAQYTVSRAKCIGQNRVDYLGRNQ